MSYTTDDTMLKYNAMDAVGTLMIANKVVPEVEADGYQDTFTHTLDLLAPLMYMMIKGVRIDQDALQQMREKVDGLIIQYQAKLNALAGRPLNANSPKDCQAYFYEQKGVKPYTKYNKKTQSSSITMDDKALQRLARPNGNRQGFEEARIIQRIRQLRKLKGTYLDIVFDKDSRLRCSYNPRGTRFGRLSSSKTIFETGMNMQNLPPAFQKFLAADENKIIINFDKRQAEWVAVAYISGDSNMIAAVESGVDVHTYTASEMFKVPQDIIKMEHKAIGSESDPHEIAVKRSKLDFMAPYMGKWLPRNMSMRQCGKKSNHGLNYDETYKMFALINEISEREAEVIIEFYHRIYPGIRRWYENTRNKLSIDRTLVNLFGRKYRFLERWGPDLFKSAYSFNPQSTVGELVNRAMVTIYNCSDPVTSDLELLMQVHDNIAFQDQYQDVDKLVQSMRYIQNMMNIPLEANGRTFTIQTDLKIGFSMGDLHEISLSLNDIDLASAIRTYLDEQKKTQ